MRKKEKYYLNENGEFVIENYQLAKPFSSFFPGIAGIWGVPTWAFYVNRGQAIASFGIKNKDCPIMEFQPANKAYYLTPLVGFRTFIKVNSGKGSQFYDAFHNGIGSSGFNITNKMVINSYELKLYEINYTLGLEVAIEYFPITNDNYGALARKLTIKNAGKKDISIEAIDGMPQIIPYGVNNMFLKKLSRTIEAWMGIENLENKVPYLRLKVDPTDRPEVVHIREGNFYLAFDKKGIIKPVVDPEAIFGTTNNFTHPVNFIEKKFTYPKDQLTRSRTPSCMSYCGTINLEPGRSYTLYTLAGNMDSLKKLKANTKRIADENYLIRKQKENRDLILSLQAAVFTKSSSINFDFYCAQNFLDNVMRGGYPLFVEHPKGKTHIQVFSRKHGDLERDYNRFLIEPTFFSQGNGNYRDINQNRRCDIWFNPELKDENIITFFSLIQIDGYNPLIIRPDRFSFNNNFRPIARFFSGADSKRIKKFLSATFTPGELFYYIEQNDIAIQGKKRDLLKSILDNSQRSCEAWHGEGFWIDHWHYCLDMLESYLRLYPEGLRFLLLERSDFTYYDNGFTVKPRSKKYILHNGKVYQYKSVEENPHKKIVLNKRKKLPFVSRIHGGPGKVYRTTLITKMLTVIANKMAGLDPQGVGVEMEADKPNWYDSLNGLPGLLGSSTCETFELKRWILFIRKRFTQLGMAAGYKIALPSELHKFLKGLSSFCESRSDNYSFWDKTHLLKEQYREKTLLGFSGINKEIGIRELEIILDIYLKKVESGISKARDRKTGLYYSYFINEVTKYKVLEKDAHTTYVKALRFKQRPLPLFLEGMVHAFRVTENKNEVRGYFNAIRKSPLYDKKLKMYKVNTSLKDMPEDIGRARVFAPGWLENESVWTHMEYKYLLEVLKSGLHDEFYQDFKNVIIAFHDPRRYGRSILENSSFMVSSAFPQKNLHGNGFVARLSGATAEFINIWLLICSGKRPFYLGKDERLYLELKPILPGWLFTKFAKDGFGKNSFAFKFLGSTIIVYHNPKRKDTFGDNAAKVKEIRLKPLKGREVILKSAVIAAPYSYEVRRGNIERIDIFLT
ncbi:MAG: hypothetical protein ABH843_08230 [Candidatus Omnitrophota bacterium]